MQMATRDRLFRTIMIEATLRYRRASRILQDTPRLESYVRRLELLLSLENLDEPREHLHGEDSLELVLVTPDPQEIMVQNRKWAIHHLPQDKSALHRQRRPSTSVNLAPLHLLGIHDCTSRRNTSSFSISNRL
jgi:hypothetical protein